MNGGAVAQCARERTGNAWRARGAPRPRPVEGYFVRWMVLLMVRSSTVISVEYQYRSSESRDETWIRRPESPLAAGMLLLPVAPISWLAAVMRDGNAHGIRLCTGSGMAARVHEHRVRRRGIAAELRQCVSPLRRPGAQKRLRQAGCGFGKRLCPSERQFTLRGETSPSFIGEQLGSNVFPVEELDSSVIDLSDATLDFSRPRSSNFRRGPRL